jgi:hypothetical protein
VLGDATAGSGGGVSRSACDGGSGVPRAAARGVHGSGSALGDATAGSGGGVSRSACDGGKADGVPLVAARGVHASGSADLVLEGIVGRGFPLGFELPGDATAGSGGGVSRLACDATPYGDASFSSWSRAFSSATFRRMRSWRIRSAWSSCGACANHEQRVIYER